MAKGTVSPKSVMSVRVPDKVEEQERYTGNRPDLVRPQATMTQNVMMEININAAHLLFIFGISA